MSNNCAQKAFLGGGKLSTGFRKSDQNKRRRLIVSSDWLELFENFKATPICGNQMAAQPRPDLDTWMVSLLYSFIY